MFESRWSDVVYRLGYLSTPSLYHKRNITYIYIKPFLTDSESLWLWVLIVIVLMWWIMLWVQDRNTAVITQDCSSSWSCFCPAADGSELSKHSVTSNIHPYSRLDLHILKEGWVFILTKSLPSPLRSAIVCFLHVYCASWDQ